MMTTLLYAFILALVVSLAAGTLVISKLKKLKARQSIRIEGPARHQAKAGTPTMGGIIILLALVISVIAFAHYSIETGLALFLTLGYGAIGFVDDFIKAVKKRNLGLTAKQKLLAQFTIAAVFCYIISAFLHVSTAVWIPFTAIYVDLGFYYYVLAFFVLMGTTNAVNLTDGLDGLAAGSSAITAVAYTVISVALGYTDMALFSVALTGACLGFLFYNQYPAKVFMGDTGSLAIGGAFAALAVLTKTELLFILLGGLFVLEALSVIIQVVSFKTRGVRVFKMSPIHHHFELSGWSEMKVVAVFWLTAAIFAIISIIIVMYKAI